MDIQTKNRVPANDGRDQPRTHLFVIAVLSSSAGSSPVRIRNMSPSGALVEAAILPPPGMKVLLKRGSLTASGTVAWQSDRKAGIAFDATVFVADWMCRKRINHQDKVDEIVSGLRQGAASVATTDDGPFSVHCELALLRTELEQLGNALANDTILVVTHPEIQSLDIAMQRVDRISRFLGSSRTCA